MEPRPYAHPRLVTFLTGLHGTIATILICALLVIDEAGVPLPFAPNELLLIFGGLLIASGSLSVFVFLPLACAAMIAGTLSGYSWAHAVGLAPLRALAERVGATRGFDRATRRVNGANAWGIFVTRLIPGVRPYATLLAGAADVRLATFCAGALPATVIWCVVLTFLGWAVGLPAERILGNVAELALSGAILVVLGFIGYRAARHGNRELLPFSNSRLRLLLAFAVDAGVVATIVAGFDRITRSVLHLRVTLPIPEGRYDALLVVAGITLSYIVASRLGRGGETAGERLFDVTYVHRRRWRRTHPNDKSTIGASTSRREDQPLS